MLSVSTVNAFPQNLRLVALIEEHNDLDEAIAAILASVACDDLLVSRLKKRKLHLKDEIALQMAPAANAQDAALTG
ncbi:MAG TPA: YdcH family protein [Rhizomicrobium sp.]|nr:YdcH family protein [Rhizomicrobium sp.]